MTNLRVRAFKLEYVPPTDNAFGTEGTFVRAGSFMCAYRATLTHENVRAGRDAQKRIVRMWFDRRLVALANADRVEIKGEQYDVIYVPDHSYHSGIVYVDIEAREVAK